MLGRTVSNYQILEKLGQGGMGIVYKALDPRLDRFVALKFLPPDKNPTDAQHGRFLLEAKSASQLNHPSIVHIYDIGEIDDSSFIAMEFVEGQTLHDLIWRHGPMPSHDVINYAIQMADAMSVAHAAGILHRDLKPGNIMVTPRGLVKILDFGLAKLMDAASPTPDPAGTDETLTLALDPALTQAGAVVGSPAYMSPEQTTGQTLDARSDIFSLGVVLHEMVTGKAAFAGASRFEILAAVLHAEPAPAASLVSGTPPQLEWIISRCVRKDPNRRFQSMQEVKIALEDLRDGRLPNWSASGTIPALSPLPIPAQAPPARRPWRLAASLAIAAAAVAAGAIWLWPRPAPPPAETIPELVRVTSDPGVSIDPSISPDGKLLVYASDRGGQGNLDLWLKQLGGAGEPIQLTRDPADDREPSFSPDGTRILFRSERQGGGIYEIATLGGVERKLADRGRRPRLSPDGKQVVYWVGADTLPLRAGYGEIHLMDSTGGGDRILFGKFAAATRPIWSPDGARILFLGLEDADNFDTYDWWIGPIDGGAPAMWRILTNTVGFEPYDWRGDRILCEMNGSRIAETRLNPKTGVPAFTPRTLTRATAREQSPSLSVNGEVAFSSTVGNVDLYSWSTNARTSPLRRLTSDLERDEVSSISADGNRLVFSVAANPTQAWTLELSGGRPRSLTSSNFHKTNAEISPDGLQVAYRANDVQRRTIFVTPFSGGSEKSICEDCGFPFVWLPDSRRLLFSTTGARSGIHMLDSRTGAKTPLLSSPDGGLTVLRPSPDGSWLALQLDGANRAREAYLVHFEKDKPQPQAQWVRLPLEPVDDRRLTWSPDSRTIYFTSLRDGYRCLWALHLDPITKRPAGPAFAARHFHAPTLRVESRSIASPPGALIASLEERASSVFLIPAAPR